MQSIAVTVKDVLHNKVTLKCKIKYKGMNKSHTKL